MIPALRFHQQKVYARTNELRKLSRKAKSDNELGHTTKLRLLEAISTVYNV